MQEIQQPKISPDLIKGALTLSCECGGQLFDQKLVIKQISAILSPTTKQLDVPIQVLVCTLCGKVIPMSDPENILPINLKSKINK